MEKKEVQIYTHFYESISTMKSKQVQYKTINSSAIIRIYREVREDKEIKREIKEIIEVISLC